MSLTIREANAANTVLRVLLDVAQSEGWDDVPADLVEAAQLLANSAHKVLFAGLTGDRVAEALECQAGLDADSAGPVRAGSSVA